MEDEDISDGEEDLEQTIDETVDTLTNKAASGTAQYSALCDDLDDILTESNIKPSEIGIPNPDCYLNATSTATLLSPAPLPHYGGRHRGRR